MLRASERVYLNLFAFASVCRLVFKMNMKKIIEMKIHRIGCYCAFITKFPLIFMCGGARVMMMVMVVVLASVGIGPR